MFIRFRFAMRLVAALALLVAGDKVSQAAIGYGVTANGALFKFNPAATAVAIPIGNMGIVPEAIDFRPTTTAGDPNRPLYAIDIGATTSQLYTVNTSTAAVTPVGAGFPTTVAGTYDLSGSQRFGFDFNPTTLAADGSIRIRLVSTNGVNLRLNSDTGVVAAVDTPLLYANESSPFADAIGYINSDKAVLPADGTTVLFDMDSRPDVLSIQNPPNGGVLNVVGAFGATIDANPGIQFDILTDAADMDATIIGDQAFAAFTRSATSGGQYLLYDVNLATGATLNGRLVGGGLDFTGGLALTYGNIPEPTASVLAFFASLMLLSGRAKTT
jgi:hypothetical protein